MKKGLLTLLAAALTIVGCQDYDSQFKELTTLVTGLAADVAGLSSVQNDLNSLTGKVDGLVTALANAGGDTDQLLLDLQEFQEDLAALQAATLLVTDGGDVDSIAEQVAALSAGITSLLEKNESISVDIIITDTDSLGTAGNYILLGEGTPNYYLLGGLLTVDHTALTAAEIVTANQLTAKILSVATNVTVKGAVNLAGLSFISGNYTIQGTVAPLDDTISNVAGNVTVDGGNNGGVIDFPTLNTIGGNLVITNTVSATSIDVSALTTAGGTLNAGSLTAANATSINTGAYVMTAVNVAKCVDLDMGQTTNAAGLTITAPKATTIDVNSLAVSAGAITVASAATTAVVHFDGLTDAVAITANAGPVSEFHIPALVSTAGGAIQINTATLNISGLTTVAAGANMTLDNTTAIVGGDTLTSIAGTLQFDLLAPASLSLPNAVVTGSLVASSTTLEIASTDDATLAKALNGVLNTTVIVNNQATAPVLAGPTAHVLSLTLNTQKVVSQATELDAALNQAGIVAAKTINVSGWDAVTVGTLGAVSAAVTVTTSGSINDVSFIDLDAMTSLNIGHTYHTYENAPAQKVVIEDNLLLASVDLTSVALLDEASIGSTTTLENPALATITAPTLGPLLSNAVVDFRIQANSLVGTHTAAVPGTRLENLTQPSLTTWKAYIGAINAVLAAPGTIYYELDIDKNGAGAANTFGTVGGAGFISTAVELAVIDQDPED